ncbi:hydrolase [Radiobacillus kanasensis]|uniref:hydrolase n=1 Tax=Radiobacillus kanasensis TaxID=2844358 RepID=UPI001E3806C8|nr:hydrolase [Radiobacillus kanasensis]UFT98172.1 hydrolase [Radiobacillus kanasensis]
MERKKYYVNIGTQEISQVQVGDNDEFIISATDEEVYQLREMMNQMYNADIHAFWRAHTPIVPYHNDKPNDDFDDGILNAFQMIHDLGDDTTRKHIEKMGVLDL